MKLVYIKWCDAVALFETWSTKEEALEWSENESWEVESVGWILKETKKYILLTSKIDLVSSDAIDDHYGLLFKIPKTWILERKELCEKK